MMLKCSPRSSQFITEDSIIVDRELHMRRYKFSDFYSGSAQFAAEVSLANKYFVRERFTCCQRYVILHFVSGKIGGIECTWALRRGFVQADYIMA